jgi:hypothetical protein
MSFKGDRLCVDALFCGTFAISLSILQAMHNISRSNLSAKGKNKQQTALMMNIGFALHK